MASSRNRPPPDRGVAAGPADAAPATSRRSPAPTRWPAAKARHSSARKTDPAAQRPRPAVSWHAPQRRAAGTVRRPNETPLFGRQYHGHLAAFHAWVLFDLGDLVEIAAHPHQHVHADFLMRQFAAAKAHRDLHLVAFLDEFEHAAHLHVVIVVVDARAQL